MCGLPHGAPGGVRRAAARRLLGVTPRRRLARALVLGAASLPSRRARPLADLPDLADAPEILARAGLAHTASWVSANWPTQRDRGRAYLHLLAADGQPRGFLKLARGLDADGLVRERAALERLDGGWPGLRAPRVLDSGAEGATTWLLTEALPAIGRQPDSRTMAVPTAALTRLRGDTRVVRGDQVRHLSWWERLEQHLPSAPHAFRARVAGLVREGIEVGGCHGDFGPHNLAVVSGELWAFDWEAGAVDAPVEQDLWSFRLAQQGEAAVAAQARGEGDQPSDRFVAACAYALAGGIGGLPALVSRWDEHFERAAVTYRDQFAEGEAAAKYDTVEYADGSYSGLLWDIEKEQLDDVLRKHAPTPFDYLDFACGTGRVLAHVAPRAATATGIEISAAMAARAHARVPAARLAVVDVTAPGAELEGTYDVVTAFRFVLNAEPSLRLAGMRALAARLRSSDAVLVFNNHGQLTSHKAILALPHLLRRGFRRSNEGNVLSHRAVLALAGAAGLRATRVAGAGLLGGRLAEKLPQRRAEAIERRFARSRWSRFGSNQLYVARLSKD